MFRNIARLLRAFRFFAFALFIFCFLTVSTEAITLPADFEDGLVATIGAPTALAFTPDGRLLITTQSGRVRVYQNNALLETPALDLSAKICTNSERGVLGIAVDPNFTTNQFIYLYYTFNKPGNCNNSTVNRVARFVLSANNTVDPASETVLIDNIHSPAGNHNGGDLHFGKDDLLYISVGDGGCDYAGNSGCAGSNDAARDRHVLLGKILRITRDGAIPTGNPYQGANSGRCNITGSTTVGNWCQETFASGLRNPFRIAFDSNASNTRFFINDVGQGVWEEIDEGIAGADYGWNIREGHCANNSTTNCSSQPTVTVNNEVLTNPVFDYQHTSNCSTAGVRGNSITGGAFVPNGVWSVGYDNSYLVGEYVCGKIFKLTPNGTGGFAASEFATGLGGSSAVAMIFGPFQTTKALYYTTYASGGQIRRISYTGMANRNPVASFTATPTSGAAPLDVTFNASASSDPDNDTFSFSWNFGDGNTGTGINPVHRYTANGTYNAVLTVSDGRGGSNSASARIDVGNTAPQPTITAPITSKLFRVGETITLQGTATDAQDGTLANNRLTWEVILHHNNDHTHPFLSPTIGNNISFTAPAPEDIAAATGSFLEIRLTATDSQGLSTTIVQNLQPRKVNVTLATNPSGLNLTVNSANVTGPYTFVSWDGYALNVNAPNQTANGQQYTFQSWSDAGSAAHTIITPATATTFTATFRATQTISGKVTYGITAMNETPQGVSRVNLNGSGASVLSAISDSSGNYQLSGLTSGGNYTVTPSKAAQTDVNGINSLDATRIQQHLIGLTTLTPNQLIAADTDNNGVVNSLDATRIQQYLVGIPSTHVIGQWKFLPASKQYNSVSSNLTDENYQAVLVGEVSGNWSSSSGFTAPSEEIVAADKQSKTTRRFENELNEQIARRMKQSAVSLSSGSESVKPEPAVMRASIAVSLPSNAAASTGNTITVPVSIGAVAAGKSIESFDFSVFYDPSVLRINSQAGNNSGTLSSGCSVVVNSPISGRVIVSGACGSAPITANTGGTLYNLNFTVIGTGNQTSNLSFTTFSSSVNTFQFNNANSATAAIDGQFTVIGAIAPQISIAGKVTNNQGRDISNVMITMIDSNGNERHTPTAGFGYYKFNDAAVGETLTITAKASRYSFNQTSIVRTINDFVSNLNFIAVGD